MENIRTNKAARTAAALLVLVLITTCIIGGTLAKYITKDQGSDSARVAKFGVVASAKGDLFGTSYANDGTTYVSDSKSQVVHFDGCATNTGLTVNAYQQATGADRVVAPGTFNNKGMTFQVKGTPEVATEFTFEDYKSGTDKYVDSDITLKVGEYGIMKPVDSSKLVITADNYSDYYKKNADGTFAELSSKAEATGTIYKLGDTSNNSAVYNPIKWTVGGTDHTTVAAAKSAIKTALGVASGSAQYDPNHSFDDPVTASTLTWRWDYTDDYATADVNGIDRKDTILGDLIAAHIESDETYFVVVKVGSGWTAVKYAEVPVAEGAANNAVVAYYGASAPANASAANVAVLTEFFGGQLTVKQIAKKAPTE